MFLKWYELRTL